MPIFDFSCQKCAHQFTVLRLAGEAASTCPACGSLHLEQIFSAINIAIKSGAKSEPKLVHKKNEASAVTRVQKTGHQCGPGCGHQKKAEGLIRKKYGN